MTSKLAREENVQAVFDLKAGYTLGLADVEILKRVARMALAAMGSEPVFNLLVSQAGYKGQKQGNNFGFTTLDAARELKEGKYPLYLRAQSAKGLESAGWQFKSVNGDWLGLIDEHGKNQAVRDGYEVREVFAMADGVNDRDQVRREHAEWSQATFGNVGPIGPLKHLAKEAMESAAEPDDLSEWADMQFLMWDAQRRAGITDEQITQAMIEKLAVNKQREWPEPKEGEPRMHIQEQPAPVVDADDNFYSWFGREWHENYQHNQYTTAAKQMLGVMAESAWKAGHRAAMLQAAPVCTCPSGDGSLRWPCPVHPGNSPVIPNGYVMVPKEPTKEMIDAGWLHYMGTKNPSSKGTYKAMLAAAPQEAQGE